MQFYKESILKNGERLIIRSGTRDDSQIVLDKINLTHTETDFLLTYPDENPFTAESEAQYLDEKEKSECECELLAFIGDILVGTAGIDRIGTKYKIKHRCEYGISIAKAFWGLGIGGFLTQACIECAKKAEFKQIELDVVAENEKAISLYKKYGFVEYGRNPKAFNSKYTGYQELVLMRLEI